MDGTPKKRVDLPNVVGTAQGSTQAMSGATAFQQAEAYYVPDMADQPEGYYGCLIDALKEGDPYARQHVAELCQQATHQDTSLLLRGKKVAVLAELKKRYPDAIEDKVLIDITLKYLNNNGQAETVNVDEAICRLRNLHDAIEMPRSKIEIAVLLVHLYKYRIVSLDRFHSPQQYDDELDFYRQCIPPEFSDLAQAILSNDDSNDPIHNLFDLFKDALKIESEYQVKQEEFLWSSLYGLNMKPDNQKAFRHLTESTGMADSATAVAYITERATQGDPKHQFFLGWLHLHGLGVPQDDSQAHFYLNRSAQEGHADGECHLALMYLQGKHVDKNKEEAFQWFINKSARKGNAEAQYQLGLMYGEAVRQRADRSTIKKVAGYLKSSAAQGHGGAQLALYSYHWRLIGLERKDWLAYLESSANLGNAEAQYLLGKQLLSGEDYQGDKVPQNHDKALIYITLSAEQGYRKAMKEIGAQCMGRRDYLNALKYLKPVADDPNDEHADFWKPRVGVLLKELEEYEKAVPYLSSPCNYKSSEQLLDWMRYEGLDGLNLNWQCFEGLSGLNLEWMRFQGLGGLKKNEEAALIYFEANYKRLGRELTEFVKRRGQSSISVAYIDTAKSLGILYYRQDLGKHAYQYFDLIPAEHRDGDTWFYLGKIYQGRLGGLHSEKNELACFQKAAQAGHQQATTELKTYKSQN